VLNVLGIGFLPIGIDYLQQWGLSLLAIGGGLGTRRRAARPLLRTRPPGRSDRERRRVTNATLRDESRAPATYGVETLIEELTD